MKAKHIYFTILLILICVFIQGCKKATMDKSIVVEETEKESGGKYTLAEPTEMPEIEEDYYNYSRLEELIGEITIETQPK